jgi:hypothetical protein
LARELIILPRFKRDYRTARKHPEFEAETLEYVFDTMISGGKLPEAVLSKNTERKPVMLLRDGSSSAFHRVARAV